MAEEEILIELILCYLKITREIETVKSISKLLNVDEVTVNRLFYDNQKRGFTRHSNDNDETTGWSYCKPKTSATLLINVDQKPLSPRFFGLSSSLSPSEESPFFDLFKMNPSVNKPASYGQNFLAKKILDITILDLGSSVESLMTLSRNTSINLTNSLFLAFCPSGFKHELIKQSYYVRAYALDTFSTLGKRGLVPILCDNVAATTCIFFGKIVSTFLEHRTVFEDYSISFTLVSRNKTIKDAYEEVFSDYQFLNFFVNISCVDAKA